MCFEYFDLDDQEWYKTIFQKPIMYAYMNKKFNYDIYTRVYLLPCENMCYECPMNDLQRLKNASLGGYI